jgi:hypothetical protein
MHGNSFSLYFIGKDIGELNVYVKGGQQVNNLGTPIFNMMGERGNE